MPGTPAEDQLLSRPFTSLFCRPPKVKHHFVLPLPLSSGLINGIFPIIPYVFCWPTALTPHTGPRQTCAAGKAHILLCSLMHHHKLSPDTLSDSPSDSPNHQLQCLYCLVCQQRPPAQYDFFFFIAFHHFPPSVWSHHVYNILIQIHNFYECFARLQGQEEMWSLHAEHGHPCPAEVQAPTTWWLLQSRHSQYMRSPGWQRASKAHRVDSVF